MGKAAMSCFNIITCSRDSTGYDDLEVWQISDLLQELFISKPSFLNHVEPPTVKESQDACQSTFYPPEDGVALDAVCSNLGDGPFVSEERTVRDADAEESAATVIQATIRRRLCSPQSHQEVKNLKSIIKLQAAVRGHLEKENSGPKHRKTYSASEKLLANGFARQSASKTKPIHIYCDPSRSDSAWKWLERWMALASLDNGQQQELNMNGNYQDKNKDIKVDVSELANDVPVAVGPVSAHSQPESMQLIIDHDSDFEFQAPDIMDECFCSPIKTHWESHQSNSDPQNVAQDSHTKEEAAKECPNSKSGGMALNPDYVSKSSGTLVDKPGLEEEKSNCVETREECEPLDFGGMKTVSEMRKACNPALLAAQSKFKDLCSAGSFKSVSTYKKEVSIVSRPENATLDYLKKGDASLTEDSAPHVSGRQAAISECDTELSISSTLDSPDRYEAEGSEIVLEFGSLGSRDFDENGHSDNAFQNLNPGANNLSEPEILQPPMVEEINEKATILIADDNSVQMDKQPSQEQHLAEPILYGMQVHQETVVDQEEACNLSPGGSPRISDITALDSHKTPSNQLSLHTGMGNDENNMHERKQRYHFKRYLSNLNSESGGRNSTERPNNGEKRNSFGMPESDHDDHEPRISSSNSLPSYMQPTESARAKVHASISLKSSPDVHDNDSHTKKRQSLPLANGKQVSSPHMQQSASQTQRSPHKPSAPSPVCGGGLFPLSPVSVPGFAAEEACPVLLWVFPGFVLPLVSGVADEGAPARSFGCG
ncbi:hypothetical protein Taro_033976 [Colocasia esculenta]|uniref:DUF4005 domain-containing protein n=1 Tax=Colocasia esculenta TaxID=4460 RepID=A0A843WAJ3_COLES|nr:hypothetical protein [Colocasia esculenta]